MGAVIVAVAILISLYSLNKFLCFWCKSKVCLVGKTALITGGASGIGYQTALTLASKGCRVIIADVTDTKNAVQCTIEKTHNNNVIGKHLDLALFKSVRDLAENINLTEPRLDILINNAGIGDVNICYTEDGLERTMQINYFGHFLLTHLLLDLLKKSSPSRIVFTSSIIAYFSTLNLEQLNPKPEYFSSIYGIFGTYSASKLMMAFAAKMFGKKLIGTGVTANSFNPGGSRTNIFFKDIKSYRDVSKIFLGLLAWLLGKSAEEGAQTLIYLAHADEVKDITGKYFMEGKRFPAPVILRNNEYCQELWDRSVLYTKLEPHEVKC
ncbi:retinol dehydrogenase 13-like [Anthonomus grandis grandis]|uniref:retinol dehydrogenase 13-like n=1 Tax=Anthonomus grandis grandis TaxID=2921223 RepID=UPI00216615C5|nr:retinol dehydrogenase 13-like [Anthonomus grandis grandis]